MITRYNKCLDYELYCINYEDTIIIIVKKVLPSINIFKIKSAISKYLKLIVPRCRSPTIS